MLMLADNITFVLSPRTPEVVSQHRCTLTVGDAAVTAPMLPAYVFRFEPKG